VKEFVSGKWRKAREMCNEKARAQIPESSIGEDRAVLLGFTMMAFSILMYFLVGIVMAKPSLYRLVSVLQVDCLLVEYFKCLRVLVSSTPEKTLRLYHDEDTVKYRPKCFYTPKCQGSKTEQEAEANNIRDVLIVRGDNMTCYLNTAHPNDAIIRRKYTVQMALYYLLWPSLMLFGGILLVGLVKFNQHLAFLCTEISREEKFSSCCF
uniref:Si:ch211-38m6.7 n=1 Tax=Sinocyclocheilus grahami TaxID=75366 RepID=A0A672KT41_SINGR